MVAAGSVRIVTPRQPQQRGCQLSLKVAGAASCWRDWSSGIVCDFREPDVVRVAPAPLYNTYHDVWRFVEALRWSDQRPLDQLGLRGSAHSAA